MRYYIADLHFFHGDMNEHMDQRGFSSTEEMNEYMIRKWNEKVTRRDEVVVLGDFVLGSPEQANEILERLHGKIYMIEGNHDACLKRSAFRRERIQWLKPYAEMSDDSRKVVLCHYPILCYNGQYRLTKKGDPAAYMLYGHVHDTLDERMINRTIREMRKQQILPKGSEEPIPMPCNLINCFCMFSDYTPLSLSEWIEVDRTRRQKLW